MIQQLGLPPGSVADSSGTNPPSGTAALEDIRESPPNLADPRWGLHLDGVTDDGAIFNALPASKKWWLPDGKSMFFSTPLVVPVATELQLGASATLLCGVTGGANAISLDHAATLKGTTKGGSSPANVGSIVEITAGAVVGGLVTHVHTDGTQEYAYVEDIQLWSAGGTCVELLLLAGIGVNSSFKRILFRCNGIATHALNASSVVGGGALGVLDFEGCWFNGSAGHMIVIDCPAGATGPGSLWFTKCAIEGWASGFDGFNLGATNAVYDIIVRDCHGERFAADGSATNVFNLIHAVNLKVDGFDLACDTSGANVTLVNIGGSASNQGTVLDRLYSSRSVTLLNDVRTGNSLTGQYLDSYRQGGSGVQGDAPRSVSAPVNGWTAPAYSAAITPSAVAGRWQTITVTNATAFTINAPTNPPTSKETQELVVEIFNNSGGAMGVITWNAAFKFNGFVWANPATGLHRYAKFEWNGANWICTSMSSADY